MLDRRKERAERRTSPIAELRKRASEADAKFKRLCDPIENGIADVSDPMLNDRVAELKAVRDQARADTERAGRFWSAQFCTEMARPAGFEPATYSLEGGQYGDEVKQPATQMTAFLANIYADNHRRPCLSVSCGFALSLLFCYPNSPPG